MQKNKRRTKKLQQLSFPAPLQQFGLQCFAETLHGDSRPSRALSRCFSCYGTDFAPTSPPRLPPPGLDARLPARQRVSPRTGGLHLPVYSVFISLESVVNGGAHTGRHGVGVGGVRVLVGVQLGPMVEVHRLHGPGAVRVSVHGGRDAHPVHPVVGQVFVLHTTNTRGHSEYTRTRTYQTLVITLQ